MAASRQVTPHLGVPAQSRFPGAAGFQNGSRQVGRPPPQCPGGSRKLGESLVLMDCREKRQRPVRDTCSLPGCPRGLSVLQGMPTGLWSPAENGVVSKEAKEKCVRQGLLASQHPAT